MCMDEYVIIICMLGESAAVSITTCGRVRPEARPTQKKKKKEVVNMYVKSSGLTDGGRRKRRRAVVSEQR